MADRGLKLRAIDHGTERRGREPGGLEEALLGDAVLGDRDGRRPRDARAPVRDSRSSVAAGTFSNSVVTASQVAASSSSARSSV